jgi:pimeloyl-ACP methyl ester carboxylesterase
VELHPIVADPAVTLVTLQLPGGPLAALRREPAGRPTGATVLMVPGYTGSKEDFRLLLPLLAAAGHPVLAVDQRGQFQSPGPDDPAAYAVDALGTELLHVIDALGGEPVHLVGHSFGGLVSRSAVLQRPGAFRSLVLMSSGPAALGGQRAEMMQFLRPLVEAGGLPAVRQALDAVEADDPRAQAYGDELRDFLRARFLAGSAEGLLAMGDALLGEPDRVGDLRAAGLPVLVLHGEHDDAWPPEVQTEMASRLGAEHAVIPGAVHSPAVEAVEPTATALLAFWAGLDEARPGPQ